MKNRWIGWFKPEGRGRKFGPLIFASIEIAGNRRKSPVVITVPKSCGTAAQRNRFRRIIRAYLLKVAVSEKPVWIRLLGQHRLPRKIQIEDWQAHLEAGLSSLGLLT